MDIIFLYEKEKTFRKNTIGICSLKVLENNVKIKFVAEYNIINQDSTLKYLYEIELYYLSGNFRTLNSVATDRKRRKSYRSIACNDFEILKVILQFCLYENELNRIFGNKEYHKKIFEISNIFFDRLKDKFTLPYYSKKIFPSDPKKILHHIIINYYLDKMGIKSHDGIYLHIENGIPAKKWLKRNDNNFLQASLDSLGIKNKYFIKTINLSPDKVLIFKSIKYVCKLFGDNYLDYIKKIDWMRLSSGYYKIAKYHTLETAFEKRNLVALFNSEASDRTYPLNPHRLMDIMYFFTLREKMKKLGIDTKFTIKTPDEFAELVTSWKEKLKHYKRGFNVRYLFPSDFIENIEKPILINDTIFKPKILKSEQDFVMESIRMHNCMAKKFVDGSYSIFVSLSNNEKTINVQFKDCSPIQIKGKYNKEIDECFTPAIEELSDRLVNNKNVKWAIDKYDLLY